MFVIIDVRPDVEAIPITGYMSIEEVETGGKDIKRTFKHIPSMIGAYEAEEVGVEHLLRDVNDPSTSSLQNQIKAKAAALGGLREQLLDMKAYLENVLAGKLPVNNLIIYNMQTIFNLLPNLNIDEMITALKVKTNDMHLVIYVSSLIRCIIALHDLVRNKIQYKDQDPDGERAVDAKEKEAKDGAAKEGEEKEKAGSDEKKEEGKK